MYYVYILHSLSTGIYYKGHTNNLRKRLIRHNSRSEKYTAKYIPWKLVWCCEKPTKKEASQLERKLKNLTRKRLEEFMLKHSNSHLLQKFT